MNTELEQRLRGDMDRATQSVRVPPGLALKAYRHNQRRKRTARTVTAAGAATVLAAAAVAGAGAAGAFGPSGPQIHTDTYLVSRVEHALSAPSLNNMVAVVRTAYPAGITLQPKPAGLTGSGGPGGSSPRSGSYELIWAYHHTSKMSVFSAAGRHLFDERIINGHSSTATTVVSYPSHTWWTATSGPAGSGPAAPSCLPGGEVRLQGGTARAWPDFIRSQLACGAYTVTGKQAVVNNVDAIEITGDSGQLTLWVSRATYLPVRLDDGPIQTSFQWMPATPANQAQLNMPIPAGFRQVPPPS
jgi:hypothetical protein